MINWMQGYLKRDAAHRRRAFLMDAAIVGLGVLLIVVLANFWIRLGELRQAQARLLERNTELLNQVVDFESEIGYGGFIHNFKNAILRPTELLYLHSAEANLASSFRTLDNISRLSASAGAPIDLLPTRNTLEQYSTALQLLKELAGSGKTSPELDRLVRIYDGDAIENLGHAPETRSPIVRRLLDLAGMGARPTAPTDFKLSLRDPEAMRTSARELLAWDFERIVIAHGRLIERDAWRTCVDAFAYVLEPGDVDRGRDAAA